MEKYYLERIPDELVVETLLILDDDSIINFISAFKKIPVINNNIGELYFSENLYKSLVRTRFPGLWEVFLNLEQFDDKWVIIWRSMMSNFSDKPTKTREMNIIRSLTEQDIFVSTLFPPPNLIIPNILHRACFKYSFSKFYDKLNKLVVEWAPLYILFKILHNIHTTKFPLPIRVDIDFVGPIITYCIIPLCEKNSNMSSITEIILEDEKVRKYLKASILPLMQLTSGWNSDNRGLSNEAIILNPRNHKSSTGDQLRQFYSLLSIA